MKKNKCEKLGFKHAWEDTTSNIVYMTNPPSYPVREETCKNCGLKRTFRKEIKEWIEYSDGVERSYEGEYGTMTLPIDNYVNNLTDGTRAVEFYKQKEDDE